MCNVLSFFRAIDINLAELNELYNDVTILGLKRKSTVFEAIEVGSDVKIRLAACGGNHSVVITHQVITD